MKAQDILEVNRFGKKIIEEIEELSKTWKYSQIYIIESTSTQQHIAGNFLKNTKNIPAYSVFKTEEKLCETTDLGCGVYVHSVHPIIYCLDYNTSQNHVHLIKHYVGCLISLDRDFDVENYLKVVKLAKEQKEKLCVYVANDNEFMIRYTEKRSADSLFLAPKLWENILNDAKDFFSESTTVYYRKHGITHKRVYIFKGIPGVGKSETIRTLASMLCLPVYIISLAGSEMSDSVLRSLMEDVDKNSILAIEDIDRIFNQFDQNESMSSVTVASLLNLLGGIATQEGVLTILTCNNFDRLNNALKRRFNKIFHFEPAKPDIIKRMIKSFHENCEEEQVDKISKKIGKIRDLPLSAIEDVLVANRKQNFEDVFKDEHILSELKERKIIHSHQSLYS